MTPKELYTKLEKEGIYNVLKALKENDKYYDKDVKKWMLKTMPFEQKEMDKSFKKLFKN